MGIVIDTVPYSLVDSIIGVWLHSLITGKRKVFCSQYSGNALAAAVDAGAIAASTEKVDYLRWVFDPMRKALTLTLGMMAAAGSAQMGLPAEPLQEHR